MRDRRCGKRLGEDLPALVARREEPQEIQVRRERPDNLPRLSARTLDRVLSAEKKKAALRRSSRPNPGSILKSQIPARPFAQGDEPQPGFGEIDLVAADGGQASGDFIQTLDVTDVSSGWTETQAVRNKAQTPVLDALRAIRARLPFQLVGIDSDNGSEFINNPQIGYGQTEQIRLTRARPDPKNDTWYGEPKNDSVGRRAVGYGRDEGDEAVNWLNHLYPWLRLSPNWFHPSMTVVSKTRVGSRVKKIEARPPTPSQRLLQSAEVPDPVKER